MSGADRPRLHVLGCGRAARALVRCLYLAGVVEPGALVNRTRASAEEAAAFIGAGTPATRIGPADDRGWLLLGLPDDGLAGGVKSLAGQAGGFALAFHLSGAVAAEVLRPLGVPVAAVHPVRSFADPATACRRFAGTWCVGEGDEAALAVLAAAMETAGARWRTIAPDNKPAWHAATATAANFLPVLNEMAEALAEAGGMAREEARAILADLQRGTLDNLAGNDPARALSGPIERGDVETCRRQREAAAAVLAPGLLAAYDRLALATLDLAQGMRGRRRGDRALRSLYSARD